MTKIEKNARSFNMSEQYWERLSQRDRDLFAIVNPLPSATYQVDIFLNAIESSLEMFKNYGELELAPDFQRGHVWTMGHKVGYIESLLRGAAPTLIRFNCTGYAEREAPEDANIGPGVQCIDGLQRLTAIREFVRGDLAVFDGLCAKDFEDTHFDIRRHRVQFQVYTFFYRHELLQFYLNLNSGGVVHSDQEIARVTALRDQAIQAL